MLATVFCQARDFYRFSQITRSQGLNSDFIRDIAQDSAGFLWFVTNNGVCRYDGYSIVPFHEDKTHRKGLYNNQTICIYSDKQGGLWFGSINGVLQRYDYRTASFENFKIAYESELDLGVSVNSMCELRNNSFLLGTTDGLYVFDRKTKAAKKINLISEYKNVHITSVCQDTDNKVWVGTMAHGVLIGNESLKSFEPLQEIATKNKSKERVPINSIFCDSNNRCWITTENDGLYVRHNKTGVIEHITQLQAAEAKNSFALQEVVEDQNKNIWICSINGGLFYVDAKSKEIKLQQWLPGVAYSGLRSVSFQPAFKSSDGTLWFGTHGNGVQFCNASELVYKHVKAEDANLPYRIVTSFFETEHQTIWVGTDGGGIAILDSNLHKVGIIDRRSGLPSNAVLSMKSSADMVWLATWAGGIAQVNQHNGKIVQTYESNVSVDYSLPNNEIKYVLPTRNALWVADNGKGLFVFDYQTKRFFHSGNEGYRQFPLRRPEFVSKCIEAKDGSIWCASVTGVYRLKNTMLKYEHQETDSLTPSGTYTQALFEDSKGRVWIATDKGVDYWLPTDNKFHRLANRFQALSVGGVVIEEDLFGRIWIGNANGLHCLDLDKMKINHYALPFDFNFYQHASYRQKSGNLLFGGNDGFLQIDPRRANKNLLTPMVRITGFSLFYSPQQYIMNGSDSVQISNAKEISLTYEQSVFGIEYAALDFTAEHAVNYWYRMQGFDSTWRLVNAQRIVTFTNLDPGKYCFSVKAENSGIFGPTTSLNITILPPWWQTIWFKILLALLLSSAFVALYRWRVYRIKKQNRILEHKIKVRTAELHQANNELQQKSNEIEAQNQQLNLLTEDLKHKNFDLSNSNEELAALTEELRWQKETLLETNKNLESSNKTKDTLFSIIGHDLRNAFHSIQGSAQLLNQSYKQMSEEKRIRMIGGIEKASQGVYGTFTNLFDWARSQTNRISFLPEKIDITQLIRETIDANEHLAQEKSIKIQLTAPESLIVLADRKMLSTVLRNLFTNAVKYTSINGLISITLRISHGMVEIKLNDTGVGIDAAKLKQLFELQATRPEPGTQNETGTGLGLVICKDFIERNGGTIHAESIVGKGSTFVIRLPDTESSAAKVPQNNIVDTVNNQSYKILVADDDAHIRENIVSLLELSQYEVLQAENGKQAFELAQRFLPSLIISDITMPEMNGYDLCKNIKNTPFTASIPVLLLTAKQGESAQIETYKSGADAYLEKPIDNQLFLARIKNIVSRTVAAKPLKTQSESISNIKPADAKLVERMQELLYKNIADAEYSVEKLADDLGLSRTHLYRKIKQLFGIAPSEYQQNIRLQAAAELLKNSTIRISEVAYSVGYSDPHYFSTSFAKYFGMTPTEYQRQWR